MRRGGRVRVVRCGASPEVLRMVAELRGRLRREDVRALAIVLVTPGGLVTTAYEGHRDGNWHTLNSGIALLRQRFDDEAGR